MSKQRYLLSLGANQKAPIAALATARERISDNQAVTTLRASRLWLAEPWGPVKQSWFVNQALLIETALKPYELLQATQQIEADLGRTREIHWGPRVIDIDLIWYSGGSLETAELVLPHKHAHERLFVLAPWAELEPDAELAPHGRVAILAARAAAQVCVPMHDEALASK